MRVNANLWSQRQSMWVCFLVVSSQIIILLVFLLCAVYHYFLRLLVSRGASNVHQFVYAHVWNVTRIMDPMGYMSFHHRNVSGICSSNVLKIQSKTFSERRQTNVWKVASPDTEPIQLKCNIKGNKHTLKRRNSVEIALSIQKQCLI